LPVLVASVLPRSPRREARLGRRRSHGAHALDMRPVERPCARAPGTRLRRDADLDHPPPVVLPDADAGARTPRAPGRAVPCAAHLAAGPAPAARGEPELRRRVLGPRVPDGPATRDRAAKKSVPASGTDGRMDDAASAVDGTGRRARRCCVAACRDPIALFISNIDALRTLVRRLCRCATAPHEAPSVPPSICPTGAGKLFPGWLVEPKPPGVGAGRAGRSRGVATPTEHGEPSRISPYPTGITSQSCCPRMRAGGIATRCLVAAIPREARRDARDGVELRVDARAAGDARSDRGEHELPPPNRKDTTPAAWRGPPGGARSWPSPRFGRARRPARRSHRDA